MYNVNEIYDCMTVLNVDVDFGSLSLIYTGVEMDFDLAMISIFKHLSILVSHLGTTFNVLISLIILT